MYGARVNALLSLALSWGNAVRTSAAPTGGLSAEATADLVTALPGWEDDDGRPLPLPSRHFSGYLLQNSTVEFVLLWLPLKLFAVHGAGTCRSGTAATTGTCTTISSRLKTVALPLHLWCYGSTVALARPHCSECSRRSASSRFPENRSLQTALRRRVFSTTQRAGLLSRTCFFLNPP